MRVIATFHPAYLLRSPEKKREVWEDMKKVRQKAILDLVRAQEIASQEELLEGLHARKIDVSQSTLSRDIQELGLANSGGVYTVIGAEPPRSSDETIRRTLREFLTEDVAVAQNIVVLKTGPGHASTVSRAIECHSLSLSTCRSPTSSENASLGRSVNINPIS